MGLAFKAIEKNKNFEVNFNSLDTSQRATIETDGENIVIQAPPGSGKTHTLITAIAAHRYDRLNDRICAITYTRAARAEMEERLRDLGIYDIEVSTIHVWARTVLQTLSVKYDFKINIIEENQIKSILEELLEQYYRKSRSKTKVNAGVLYSYITGNKNMDITDAYRRILAGLEEKYIIYKRDNGLYDFTDYPLYLYDVMEMYDEYVKDLDALFVDEFQDVDPIQFKVFERVLCRKKFFIGDERQSIYVFRGADGEAFSKLNDFNQHKLGFNYRSYQEIINYASNVYDCLKPYAIMGEESTITEITTTKESLIKCMRGYGGKVILIPSDTGEFIKNGVNSMEMIKWKTAFNDFMTLQPMILCRTNKQVKAIQESGYPNVSTIHQAKGLEYDNVIVIDTIISSLEDLNVAYVALTRAKNNVMVVAWNKLEEALFKKKKLNFRSGWRY